MKPITLIASAIAFATSLSCYADDGDETLRFYLSKSDLVVLGTIHSQPIALSGEAGVPNYICEFTVSDVCKGDAALKGKTIKVNIKRFEMERKDRHPLIEKGAECILLLQKEGEETSPQWVTADFWFGIQHASPWMVRSLKRLAKR